MELPGTAATRRAIISLAGRMTPVQVLALATEQGCERVEFRSGEPRKQTSDAQL